MPVTELNTTTITFIHLSFIHFTRKKTYDIEVVTFKFVNGEIECSVGVENFINVGEQI